MPKEEIQKEEERRACYPLSILLIAFILGILLGIVIMMSDASSTYSKSEVALSGGMRVLWEDHITWTRLAIISIADGLDDKDNTVARLMKNQEDLGNAIKPYYGNAAGDNLTALLKEHIAIAAEFVQATKDGNATHASDAETRWYKNADDIATLLSAANPNWPKNTIQTMLYDHLRLTKEEAVARLSKKYDEDIAAFDKIQIQALMMADTLSSGIIMQFPEKFESALASC